LTGFCPVFAGLPQICSLFCRYLRFFNIFFAPLLDIGEAHFYLWAKSALFKSRRAVKPGLRGAGKANAKGRQAS